MRMIPALLLSVSCIYLPACDASESALPYRRQCIVRVDIDWPATTTKDFSKEKLLREISRVISTSESLGGPGYLVSQAIPSNNRDVIYLQFKQDCTNRLEMATRLTEFVSKSVTNAPDFDVASEFVEPGLETIEVWGPSWQDSPDQ